ncbi:hypothetical protein D9613_001694 [Agrocybe pediades]|uniref:OPT oligopeptide transporter n=1 Tax=Agrocybe pediades TaxID=84607 RepID=A0A8H4R899_9AGAR|nr:hypothetical protein D9613_001694 [Agrocybe pediades]
MEDTRPYSSSTEQIDQHAHFRARIVPDVPEDVDFLMEHLNDPNFDLKKNHPPSFESLEKGGKKFYASEIDTDSHFESDRYSTSRAESRNSTAIDFDDESPYPEVRAAVSSVDDPLMPVNTFRMWFIGIIFALITSGFNQIFALRYPSIYITGIVAQLVSLPVGRGLARILPTTKFNTFGYVWSLNPGPFSIKEHVCITVMANVVWGVNAFSTANNVVVNALFGTNTGLGMSLLSFDWGMIAFIGSPLITPWWSQMNTGVGFVIMFWLVAPILYFTNVWNSAYFPISAPINFDNQGSIYAAANILTDGVFDQEKYSAYSPVFLPTTLALAYGIAFAAFTAVFVHTFLWFRKDIMRRFRSSLKDERDVHSRLMQYYPEVPHWWYAIVGVISFAFFCIAIEIVPTQFPIWAAIVAIIIASVLAIPLAMLQAITNQQVPTQVMHELIAGYMLPGRPIANVLFKTIGFIVSNQAVSFAGDLKLGHYMKIPPRVMFMIQVVAASIACIWVTLVQDWMLSNIEDICTQDQAQGFRCPGSVTFYTSSVVWGAVGPKRLFSPGAPYSGLLWFFLVGAVSPIPFYFLARRFPLSWYRYINMPIFFAGLSAMPPASGINYASWVLVGFIFNYCIRRFHFRWWMRYNYILSAALDAGVVFAMVIIFFSLQLAKKEGVQLNWWGNLVWQNTADAAGMPFKAFPETGAIGPATWA